MDEELLAIQQLFPRIYRACHVRHTRSRAGSWRLSERDQSVLAHLSPRDGTRPSALARHLGVGLPTLSEAVARLVASGYVVRRRVPADGRATSLLLTERGTEALRATSVLDEGRLRAALGRLLPRERRAVVRGLALLANAAVSHERGGGDD